MRVLKDVYRRRPGKTSAANDALSGKVCVCRNSSCDATGKTVGNGCVGGYKVGEPVGRIVAPRVRGYELTAQRHPVDVIFHGHREGIYVLDVLDHKVRPPGIVLADVHHASARL